MEEDQSDQEEEDPLDHLFELAKCAAKNARNGKIPEFDKGNKKLNRDNCTTCKNLRLQSQKKIITLNSCKGYVHTAVRRALMKLEVTRAGLMKGKDSEGLESSESGARTISEVY